MVSKRWKVILIATGFNLLFEYSLRGVNNLKTQPFLFIVLFAVYFSLFTMVEDLIVRFKLRDYHLMILAFFYGTIYNAFTSGITFVHPTFLGIDFIKIVLINLFWWGGVQALLTFYLAGVLNTRDWNHARLSRKGWIIFLLINIAAICVFQLSGMIPKGTPLGRLTILVITLLSLGAFIVSMKWGKRINLNAQKSGFLTGLSTITVLLFLFSALFLTGDPIRANTSQVNALSLRVVSFYTLVLGILLLGYRVFMKKEIPV